MPAHDKTTTFSFLDSPAAVEQFVRALKDSPSIAIDTEGASFHRYVDRVYLIQLSGPGGGAIIDPLSMQTPPALGALLESPDIEIVFHDADYDLRLLHQDYDWSVRNIFDTRIAAQLLGIKAFGLGALLEQFFGVRLDKKFQRADWSARPLTPEMLQYAALDTRYLLELRDKLAADLRGKGRLEWAQEEFGLLEGTRWDAGEDDEAFLRIKGARDLSRAQLAILREVAAWRDSVAREMDRAVFRVIGNEPMLAIATSPANTIDEIMKIKGVPRGLVGRRGEELLSAVERGRSTAPEKHPRFPRTQRYDRDAGFNDRVARLRAARDAAATKLDLDPGVLCSRERLEAIARRMPRTADELREVEGMRRWQVDVLGTDLLKAIGDKL